MKGIVMKRSLMLLALSLMLAIAPVSAQQTNYTLTVPVHQNVPASLTRMRAVLTALNATFGTEATLGYIDATLGRQRHHVSVMPDGTSIDQTTVQATRLNVTCVDMDGGAETLCREIQRRYERR
jgi:hypothetical protein